MCDQFKARGPIQRAWDRQCVCRPDMDSGGALSSALRHRNALLAEQGGISTDAGAAGANPLLDIRRFDAFRRRLLTFDAACPPTFGTMIKRMSWLGSGVAHTVYALNARDAAGFGVQHAILRVNTNEFCEGSDPYRGRLLDRLVVEAWVNVQMGQMGVGPAVLHSCLQRRIAPGETDGRQSVTLALIVERWAVSLSALLVHDQPDLRLPDETENLLVDAVLNATTAAELVLVDNKLQNHLAKPPVAGEGTAWRVVMTDFDPPLTAYMPGLSATCRSLFTLTKLGLELVCGARSNQRPSPIGSILVEKIEELERQDPQCAQALFSSHVQWDSVPADLMTLLGWYPCVLNYPGNGGFGRPAAWFSCMMSGDGRMNRHMLSKNAAGAVGRAWTAPADPEAAFKAKADSRSAPRDYDSRLFAVPGKGRRCVWPKVDDADWVYVPRPPPPPSPPSPPSPPPPPSPLPRSSSPSTPPPPRSSPQRPPPTPPQPPPPSTPLPLMAVIQKQAAEAERLLVLNGDQVLQWAAVVIGAALVVAAIMITVRNRHDARKPGASGHYGEPRPRRRGGYTAAPGLALQDQDTCSSVDGEPVYAL